MSIRELFNEKKVLSRVFLRLKNPEDQKSFYRVIKDIDGQIKKLSGDDRIYALVCKNCGDTLFIGFPDEQINKYKNYSCCNFSGIKKVYL